MQHTHLTTGSYLDIYKSVRKAQKSKPQMGKAWTVYPFKKHINISINIEMKLTSRIIRRDTNENHNELSLTTPTRMAKIKMTDNHKCSREFGALRIITYWWWECKLRATLEATWQDRLKLNVLLPLPIYIQQKCVHMCSKRHIQEYLQTHYSKCKQPEPCPSTVRLQMEELWHTHSIGPYREMEISQLHPYIQQYGQMLEVWYWARESDTHKIMLDYFLYINFKAGKIKHT